MHDISKSIITNHNTERWVEVIVNANNSAIILAECSDDQVLMVDNGLLLLTIALSSVDQ